MLFRFLDVHFFQGTDATVGDRFAPLGPPLLPWENCMGRGQSHPASHGQTLRLLDPIGRFGEKH